MAHHITNRKRSYNAGTTGFFWEGLNAFTYIVGALCFVVGSVFFLPPLARYSAAGAWLFIIGSLIYMAVALHDFAEMLIYYRHTSQRGRKTTLEFLTLTGYVIGSALFSVGATINVTQITAAGSLIGLQLLNAVAICFVIGSIMFLIASIPYLWSVEQSSLRQTLFTYLAGQFIFASLLFLAGGVANFYRAYRMQCHRVSNRANSSTGSS